MQIDFEFVGSSMAEGGMQIWGYYLSSTTIAYFRLTPLDKVHIGVADCDEDGTPLPPGPDSVSVNSLWTFPMCDKNGTPLPPGPDSVTSVGAFAVATCYHRIHKGGETLITLDQKGCIQNMARRAWCVRKSGQKWERARKLKTLLGAKAKSKEEKANLILHEAMKEAQFKEKAAPVVPMSEEKAPVVPPVSDLKTQVEAAKLLEGIPVGDEKAPVVPPASDLEKQVEAAKLLKAIPMSEEKAPPAATPAVDKEEKVVFATTSEGVVPAALSSTIDEEWDIWAPPGQWKPPSPQGKPPLLAPLSLGQWKPPSPPGKPPLLNLMPKRAPPQDHEDILRHHLNTLALQMQVLQDGFKGCLMQLDALSKKQRVQY